MKPIYRRIRRRTASQEAAVAKKENKQEQSFFGETTQAAFFPPAPLIQRKCAGCEKEEKLQRLPEKKEEEKKLMKKEDKKEEEKLQKKEAGTTSAGATNVSAYVSSLNGKGNAMPAKTNQFFSARMGYDFSNVKLHTDKAAADSAKAVNAKAYTVGNHIVFNEGHCDDSSGEGKRLMAHELAHVVQQNTQYSKLMQRKPDEKKQADYDGLVSEGKWCRDSKETGKLHPGMQCYREIPATKGYPSGNQVCFDEKTGNFVEDSPDFVSAVSGQNKDGTCDIPLGITDPPQPFTQRGRRALGHFIGDICTEDANLCGGGFGALSGVIAGIGLPKHGLDNPGMGSVLIPLVAGSISGWVLSKGMPVVNRFALRHGFVPSYSLAMGGSQQQFSAVAGMGFEQRKTALPLIPLNTYFTVGLDAVANIGKQEATGTAIVAKLGLRLDYGQQGGLFATGAVGAGVRLGDTVSTALSKELGVGYRVTDFMDLEVVGVKQDSDKDYTFLLKLNLVAPQKVLAGHPK